MSGLDDSWGCAGVLRGGNCAARLDEETTKLWFIVVRFSGWMGEAFQAMVGALNLRPGDASLSRPASQQCYATFRGNMFPFSKTGERPVNLWDPCVGPETGHGQDLLYKNLFVTIPACLVSPTAFSEDIDKEPKVKEHGLLGN